MADIADDIIDGLMCSGCGVYFEKEHGYPVLCKSCFEQEFNEDLQATEEEL